MAYFPCVGPQVEDKIVMSGNPLSFETDDAQLAQNVTATYNVTQSGSGDPSPTNVMAISGYDEIDLAVPRKNLFKVNNPTIVNKVSYVISGNTIAITNTNSGNGHYAKWNMRVNEGEIYTLSAKVTAKSETTLDARLRLASGGTYYDVLMTELNTTYSVTITIPSGVSTLEIFLCPQVTASGSGQSATFSEIQVEKSETATTYEPYNPITDISISLNETLYGGTWYVESGELPVTHARVGMGDLTWTYDSANTRFYTTVNGRKYGALDYTFCDIYKNEVGSSDNDKVIWGGGNNTRIYVKDTTYTDASTFTTAVTGHYIVYKLDTPITYHLTPHQVKLLQGANVVTSNATSMTLKYRKGEIAKLEDLISIAEDVNALGDKVEDLEETWAETNKTIAPREGATASKNYTIGEWIVDSEGYSGIVIASVSQGSAWTLNTNYLRRNRNDSASAFIRLASVSDKSKTFNEVLNSFWSYISNVASSRKLNLAIAESGSGGRRYIYRAQLVSDTEAYFQRMMLSISNQGRIDIVQFYCHATNSKLGTNYGGTYTDLSSNTISGTTELLLFI